jgi:ketosteroid isomerase-like protein
VAVGDQHIVAVQHATAEHGGKRLDMTGCQLMRIKDGKIAHVRGHYSDQYTFDDFWAQ